MTKQPSNLPPPVICMNDRVLLHYAVLDESVGYRVGHGLFFVDGEEIGRVPCLAICRERDSNNLTLYYCDTDWSLAGVATGYESVEAAKAKAERIYPGSSMCWTEAHFTDEDVSHYLADQDDTPS